eukprot:COSAG06_NODE_5127_length_3699_cov_22.423611_1_plen_497_part_00
MAVSGGHWCQCPVARQQTAHRTPTGLLARVGMDAEVADLAEVHEHETPETTFDLPISDMFGNGKILANNRTNDAVSTAKQKLAKQTGTEPDAVKLLLLVDGDPPTQIDLEIETRTLGEYGVGPGSRLRWQAQVPADAKARREEREAERLRAKEAERARLAADAAETERRAKLRQATHWVCLMLLGVTVTQAGLWSLYGSLGLVGGIIGGALTIWGANGFVGMPGHSAHWTTRITTRDSKGNVMTSSSRDWFWGGLLWFALLSVPAIVVSAINCPAIGAVPANGDLRNDTWVVPAPGAVLLTTLDDQGRVDEPRWVSPEEAQAAQQAAQQYQQPSWASSCANICDSKSCGTHCPICVGTGGGYVGNGCSGCGAGVQCSSSPPSSAAPACTNTCRRSNNTRCEDGGLSSASSYCPLGSDTADCGCRTGTTVADWLPQPTPLWEYGWGDRAGKGPGGPACGASLFFVVCLMLPGLLVGLCEMCEELVRMWRPADAAAHP